MTADEMPPADHRANGTTGTADGVLRYDPNHALLQIAPDDLTTLVGTLTGRTPVSALDERWERAGIVVDGAIHPTVAEMVRLVLAPHRQLTIDRNEGRTINRLSVGWERSGRATITDGGPDGRMSVTATRFELLPALLLHAVRLHGEVPHPAGRQPIVTTARTIDTWFAAGPGGERDTSGPLARLLDHWSHAFHAVGAWRGAAVDRALRVVHAGPLVCGSSAPTIRQDRTHPSPSSQRPWRRSSVDWVMW